MTNLKTLFGLALLGGTMLVGSAQAQTLLTGPAGGFYEASCKAYTSSDSFGGPSCQATNGTADNIARVVANPKLAAYGQANVIAMAMEKDPTLKSKIAVIRDDLGVECMYLAARTRAQLTMKAIREHAEVATFAVVKGSGTAETLAFIRSLDPDKLGKVAVVEVDSFDAAVAMLDSKDTRNVIVPIMQVPDPEAATFRQLSKAGAKFIGLSNRQMSATQIDGKPVYRVMENTPILGAVVKDGKVMNPPITTTCTNVVLFSGTGAMTEPGLVNGLKSAKTADFLPDGGSGTNTGTKAGTNAGKGTPGQISEKAGALWKRVTTTAQKGWESVKDGWNEESDK